jgi:hypothetical protein
MTDALGRDRDRQASERRFNDGRAQRGFGRVIYGESGLGEVPPDERAGLGFQESEWAAPAMSGFAGRGPKGYRRSDARLREDICERLSEDDEVDASEVSVRVEGGEVTLEGSTETRGQKQRAELIAAGVAGVSDVHNRLRVLPSVARR